MILLPTALETVASSLHVANEHNTPVAYSMDQIRKRLQLSHALHFSKMPNKYAYSVMWRLDVLFCIGDTSFPSL